MQLLIDDSDGNEKAKGTRKCIIKQKRKFKDYKNCLEVNQLENEMNHPEKIISKKVTKNS